MTNSLSANGVEVSESHDDFAMLEFAATARLILNGF